MPWNVSGCLDPAAFAGLADALARDGRADLFLSGPGCPGATRNIIGFAPCAELAAPAGTPVSTLADFCFATPGPALGFASYGHGLALRGVTPARSGTLPGVLLRKYGAWLEYDAATRRADIHGPEAAAVRRLECLALAPPAPRPFAPPAPGPMSSSLSQAQYEARVARTLEHIRAGDIYQLNLSIRFGLHAPDLDAVGLFAHLWRMRPASYYAFMRHGPFEIVSTSPERFLRVAGGEVLSQPIKGTLTLAGDRAACERRLTASPKEDAELSMIVDLVRNDISGCCGYGSVRVGRHKAVFAVDGLLQMYSDIHGRLRPGRTCLDLLYEAFPPGSVTGCPKRRALEIIDALEPHARELYCGCLLAVRGEGDMDSSVAIRTGWKDVRDGVFSFFAGSGIVVDSVPEMEYAETVAKAEKFLALGAR
jgi:para-aminobenzoate synthetase component 1